MYWLPYLVLMVNVVIIWLMPKNLTKLEIYINWVVIALINLSTDIIFSFYFKFYELADPGLQLGVHIIELTLAASFGILYLNFIPKNRKFFWLYLAGWLVLSILFEFALVKVNFINYFTWKLWYSVPYYLTALLFTRWHQSLINRLLNKNGMKIS
jgi:hypothetical protein